MISAGGVFSAHDNSARKVIASHIKRQSIGNSPGTSFGVSDIEIFLHTGIDNASDGSHSAILSTYCSPEPRKRDSNKENQSPRKLDKPGSINSAAQRIKRLLHWPKMKNKTSDKFKKPVVEVTSGNASDQIPIPLRQRFSKPSSLINNKRTLSVRSNVPSPTAKKKLASGLMHGVMQAIPNFSVPHRSRSSSFSKISVSSQSSSEAQKGGPVANDISRPSTSRVVNDDERRNSMHRRSMTNAMLMNPYLCFGASGRPVEAPAVGLQPYDVYERSVLAA